MTDKIRAQRSQDFLAFAPGQTRTRQRQSLFPHATLNRIESEMNPSQRLVGRFLTFFFTTTQCVLRLRSPLLSAGWQRRTARQLGRIRKSDWRCDSGDFQRFSCHVFTFPIMLWRYSYGARPNGLHSSHPHVVNPSTIRESLQPSPQSARTSRDSTHGSEQGPHGGQLVLSLSRRRPFASSPV